MRRTAPASAVAAANRGPQGRREGFILVEMLVTLALSAFLLVALGSLISLVVGTFDRAALSSQQIEDANRVIRSLARELSLAERVTWNAPDSGFILSGTPTRLLIVVSQLDDGVEAPRVIELEVVPTDRGTRLTRREGELTPATRGPEDVAFTPAETIYEGRYAIAFAYFGSTAAGGEALSDTWRRPDEMPTAIRVSIASPGGFSLRVPLQIDAEPGCVTPDDAACSYSTPTVPAASEPGDAPGQASGGIDPNDSLGWARYAR